MEIDGSPPLELSSYARLESRHGTVVHVVGGAHVLPSSVLEVRRATKLASTHPRFAGVLLEMCSERSASLKALVKAPPDSPPPLLPSLWDGIKGSGPLVIVQLYYAAAEALLRGRIGQEQAAAARIAARHKTNVLLVDRPMTATGLRVLAAGLLCINPFVSTELADAFRSRTVGPLGPLSATSTSVAQRFKQRRRTDEAASSPEAAAEAARAAAADSRRRMKDMFMLTRAPRARAATEEEIRAVMLDSRECVGGMVATGLDQNMDPSLATSWSARAQGAALRAVEEPLLHERDVWLAHAFRSVQRRAPRGSHVVAVVGSGHVVGVVSRWMEMEAFVEEGGYDAQGERERERQLDAWVNRLADVDVAAAIVQSSARHAIGLLLASSASCFLFARAVLPPLWRRRYAGFVGVASVLGTLNSAYQINTHWNGVRILQQRWHADFERSRGRA